MQQYQTFQIVNCRFYIEEDYLRHFHAFWTWKLDPYRISTQDGEGHGDPGPEDLIIGIDKAENRIPGSLLSVLSMGFFELRCFQALHQDQGNDIFPSSDGYLYRYIRKSTGQILVEWYVDPRMRHFYLRYDHSETAGALSFEILGRIIDGALENAQILLVHGALIEYNGFGIIISAPSQTGKTTHARLWRDHRHALIINGDVAALRRQTDSWYGYGLPWSGSSGEQINRAVPLKAIVILEQAPNNQAELITGLQAFENVLSNCRYPSWIPETALTAIDLVSALTEEIPVIRLRCLPDIEAVETLLEFLS